MAKPRVFVTRRIPEEGLRMVEACCLVRLWDEELPPPYETLREEVRQADGLLCLLTERVDRPLLEAGGHLRVVSNMAVGFDNVDVAAATALGIPVGHTPGVLTETTADLAWALLMAAARRVVEADRYTRAGRWRTWGPLVLLGEDVHGATLGIVGMGRIGRAVARRALGFGMRVLYYDPLRLPAEVEQELGATQVPLTRLLQESDFVTLHVSLTPDSRHLMNRESFARMKRTAVLVNTSRGPVVDQAALYEALRDGVIRGAALDVTEVEPLAPDDPLLTLENCVVTPHIASASVATRGRMARMAAENLIAGLEGRPLPHCANPDVYKAR